MAEKRDTTQVAADGNATMPKITWNDEGMESSYANVCNVTGTKEEVVLYFGVNQAWQGSTKEVTVKLKDRIILSPHAARRLQALLGRVMQEYESRFGSLESGN